ncbi:phosphate ABC transporter substrate-binding protein PstS [Schumannella sp. 10F1B-5-1]|uniref:phosphate ABC transporter substrate-binding protein PstS n=1 Tax=Schumannella sp. 10F1B-5-1 TaxID=2590780 RepID=UPI002106B05B|nr:phosphate ABC transporter substrate-binding protein PstS [Schumannella sp. 10F1B-5-1]
MNISRIGGVAAIAIVGAIALSSCAANEAPAGDSSSDAKTYSGTLNGIGSSAQGQAEITWGTGFQTANPDATVNYDPQGSGAGRTSFISGAADFAGSDAALKDEELSQTFAGCAADTKGIDLPVYISPIAIAYNVDGLKDLKLDAATIAGIFKGTITKWNDDAIASQNDGADLPDADIRVVHRSDDSGTTQNFTEYLAANAADVWDAAPSQTYPYTIGDAAKGTSGVADTTSQTANSITYIDESGAGDLSIAQLKVGDNYVKLTAEGASEVVANSPIADGREDNDLAIAIDRTYTSEKAYPLLLVSYMIVCQEYADADKAELVKGYASYVASEEGQKAAAEQAGSAPLSSDLAKKVADAIASIK